MCCDTYIYWQQMIFIYLKKKVFKEWIYSGRSWLFFCCHYFSWWWIMVCDLNVKYLLCMHMLSSYIYSFYLKKYIQGRSWEIQNITPHLRNHDKKCKPHPTQNQNQFSQLVVIEAYRFWLSQSYIFETWKPFWR